MSTYYYAVCRKCKRKTFCWGRWAGGVAATKVSDVELLQRFWDDHTGCTLEIASEHDMDLFLFSDYHDDEEESGNA